MTKTYLPQRDPVVAEMRAIKERLASRFDYDVEQMLLDAQRRQRNSRRRVVTLAGRSPASV